MTVLTSQQISAGFDPAEGFIQYISTIKPYHTKLLDSTVTYVYSENIDVVVNEKWNWDIELTRPNFIPQPPCGFGVVWDSPEYIINDFPNAQIIQAIGNTIIKVSFLTDTITPSNIVVSYNPNSYPIEIGDPITFRTTGTFPAITSSRDISPGQIYYITSVVGGVITISTTLGGIPLTFLTAGSGDIILHQETLKYNSFLVSVPPATQYNCAVTNLNTNQVTFTNTYAIRGVDITHNTWSISGDISSLLVIGNSIYINDNGIIVDGQYTISTFTVVGGNTNITTIESIPSIAQVSGTLSVLDSVDMIPNWINGLQVQFSSTGTLPHPINSTDLYYFIPTEVVGVFSISTTQFPTSFSDIIDFTTSGSGILNIARAEVFYPNAIVEVTGSYTATNDGTYYVRSTAQEGIYNRIYVVQQIPLTTPSTLSTDGTMAIGLVNGYSLPNQCIPLNIPDLYVQAFVSDTIQFEYSP